MSSGLAKTILQGTVQGKEKVDKRRSGKTILIKEWTGMNFASSTTAAEAEDRPRWKEIVVKSSVVYKRPHKILG